MMDEKGLKGSQAEGMSSSNDDWRAELTPEIRQKVVNKILESLHIHYQVQPSSDLEFSSRLTSIAAQFEDKTFRHSASKESYMYTIGKKMGAIGSKTEASKTGTNSSVTGPGQTSIANDAVQSSETNAVTQFSQHFASNNLVEQNIQQNKSPSFQRDMPGSQSSDQNLMYQLQRQEFQDQIMEDEVQNTSKSFVNQPDNHNWQPQQRQKYVVASQTTQNPFSQLSSLSTQYRQSPLAQSSSSLMFQQNQQLRQQNDASEHRQWSMPHKNVSPSFQQPLGQQRDVSEMQLQRKMDVTQPLVFNAQPHQNSSTMIQKPRVTAAEQNIQINTQPGQLHPILYSQTQSGLSQEGIQPRPQTSDSFRSIADLQNLFQSQRSFAGSSSASVEPKSSSQLPKTVDGVDEAYQKFLDFKEEYSPQIEKIQKTLKSILDKATDPEIVKKYENQVTWIERMKPIFTLRRNQMANICKDKLQKYQDAIIKFVNYFRRKRTPSVEKQEDLSLPNSGQSLISQPPQSWSGKLQFPPVNLTITKGLGSSSPTSSLQLRVPTSRPNFFNSPPYSSGVGIEQRNGPSMLQPSARITGQNVSATPENANFSSNNNVNPFDSPLAHHTRLSQNLKQPMQKQIIMNRKEQEVTVPNPATESLDNMNQALIPTTTHQPHSSSPRKSLLSSAHIDQQTLPLASPASTPLTPASTFVALTQVDNQTESQNQSTATGTPEVSASPLVGDQLTSPFTASDTIPPFQRLLRAVTSLSPEVLRAAVHDIDSVVNVVDNFSGGTVGGHSRAPIGEDLVSETRYHVQQSNFFEQQLGIFEGEMDQLFSEITWDTVGQPMDWISDSDSTATSRFNKLRVTPSKDLLDEIRRVNGRLVETLVEVDSTEDGSILPEVIEGTVIKCTYTAVSLSEDLKALSLFQMFPVLIVHLLVPADYPNISPVILDKLPVDLSEKPEDLSEKIKLKFSIALRNLSEPMSLLQIAKTWDASGRAVLLEYVKPLGGGCFSSRYGEWEDCSSV